MNSDIRKHIVNNFKDTSIEGIRESIELSIKEGDEITLPGLGALFEVLWINSSEDDQKKILDLLNNNLN